MKKLLLVILALIILAVVVFAVRTFGARDQTDTVKAKDAATLVDADGSSAELDAGDRPEPGTYTYTGEGKESVDTLGGSEHVFPDTIATVVELDADDECRWTSNVVFAKQHIEERKFCTKGTTMTDRGFVRKIEFFNQLQIATYTCDENAERLRTDAQTGDTWEWECAEGLSTTSKYTAEMLGEETLTVGGEQVPVWHTKVVSKQSGDTVGGDTSEFWITETGLVVKFTGNLDVKTKSVLGQTRFREQLSYALTSMVPDGS